jgi:GT2 family glycosyltransferase
VNLGYGGGNNLGISRALDEGVEYVLLLNTDADITADSVGRLLELLDTQPEISIIGPVIEEGDDLATQHLVGGRDIARHAFTRNAALHGDVRKLSNDLAHPVDHVSGAIFLVRTSVLKEIGLLDEQYFFSGEIADLCKRARDQGHKICVHLEVVARHNTHFTPKHLRETLYVYYGLRNRFLYIKKHHPVTALVYFVYWTSVGLVGVTRAALQGKIPRARALSLAMIHAYCRTLWQSERQISCREPEYDAAGQMA